MIQIDIINASTVVTDDQIKPMIAAVQRAVQNEFSEFGAGGRPAQLNQIVQGQTPNDKHWWCTFLDNSDTAGALGYHDETPQGAPLMKVFAGTDLLYKASVSVTFSHEIFEVIGDPLINLIALTADGRYEYAYENCFEGSTCIALANGSSVSIEELSKGSECFVRSLNKSGSIVAARARAFRTKKTAATLRIKFSDGSTVRCTPDHRFLLENGTWVNAKSLCRGQVLHFDMFPSAALPYVTDGALANFETLGQKIPRFIRSQNFSDDFFREFGVRTSFSSKITSAIRMLAHAAFFGGVSKIFSAGPNEKMVRSNAFPVVTAMTNKKPFWYRSYVQLVREAVGMMKFIIGPQLTVASTGISTHPLPTTGFDFIHSTPKNFFDRRSFEIIGANTALRRISSLPPSGPVSDTPSASANFPSTPCNTTNWHVPIIDSIEDCGDCPVFDLNVPSYGNFVLANGAVVHNCDGVEADEDGYTIDGVLISNFVTNRYFEDPAPTFSQRFDYRKLVTKPFEIRPGGYLSYRDLSNPTMGWQQKRSTQLAGKRVLKAAGSRTERRQRSKNNWVRSTAFASQPDPKTSPSA